MRHALFAFALVACARVDEDAPSTAADTGGETGAPSAPNCAGATTGTYTCGGEARACDPSRPTGLPSGACTAGASCDVIVRPASCLCDEDEGPRAPWSCSCVGGNWRCAAQPPDGRTCGCTSNPPFAASCEMPAIPTGADERRFVGLDPATGTRTSSYAARVTLQSSSPMSAEIISAIRNSIRLFSVQQKAWVRATIDPVPDDPTFLAWTVRPRDLPVVGEWVLRVGPLPSAPGLAYVDGALVYCEGFAETHFTVLDD